MRCRGEVVSNLPVKTDYSDVDRALYTRIAYYYYKRGLTQEEIAKRVKMSRQRVNRILGDCEALGIVEIHVVGSQVNTLELEGKLEKRFGLNAARVIGDVNEQNITATLGKHAGLYLAEALRDGDVVGFSRGRTLSAMVQQMPMIDRKNLMATQLMGGWNRLHNSEGCDDIVHIFATKMQAAANIMYTPVVVRDAKVRSTIMREPFYTEAYEVVKNCTVAVFGIGTAEDQNLLPSFTPEDCQLYLDGGAVGEICTRFYDAEGHPVETSFDERILAISRQDLLRIPLRIGVAGTAKKLLAIQGALKGGYVNVLVTDIATAQALCKD